MLYRLVSHIPHILFKPVYDAYESYLLEKVKSGNIPKHVAIIMDGNRRWARKQKSPLVRPPIRIKEARRNP